METFSFNLRINLSEEGKRVLVVISFECTISVFSIIDENSSFSISTQGHWNSKDGEKLFNKLNKLIRA